MDQPAKKSPERTCAATGAKGPPAQFIRFVAGPKNAAGQTVPFPDFASNEKKLPGRGIYLTPTEDAYKLALKKKVFAHQLETNQPPPPWPELAAKLAEIALQKLGLAKKAGQLVLGLEKVQEASAQLQALLLAADCGADARAKAEKLAARLEIRLMLAFSRAALSNQLGQANATVIGLTNLDTAWPAVHKALLANPALKNAASATDASTQNQD